MLILYSVMITVVTLLGIALLIYCIKEDEWDYFPAFLFFLIIIGYCANGIVEENRLHHKAELEKAKQQYTQTVEEEKTIELQKSNKDELVAEKLEMSKKEFILESQNTDERIYLARTKDGEYMVQFSTDYSGIEKMFKLTE